MTVTPRHLLLLLFFAHHIFSESVSSYCSTAIKYNCQIEYVKVQGYKELTCPNTTDSGHVTWHYKRTLNGTWTSFPFRFCDCSECTFLECEIKHNRLRLRYAEGEYEGFYECRTNQSKHCFKLQINDCQDRDEQVIFEPPRTYLTTTGNKLTLRCGANFGCNNKIMGNISWEQNKQIINDTTNKRYHICHRRNVTYFATELMIENVEEDDFHHLFVCVVTEGIGKIVRRYNVSLINTDPRKHIISMSLVIPSITSILLLLIIVCFVLACWCCRKYPDKCFCLMTNLPCFSRLYCTGKLRYHVFILHEQDDSEIANSIKEQLSSYNVLTMNDILLGTDPTQKFKELIKKCGSLIVIYPGFRISDTFDHQITIGKQTVKPYQISAIVQCHHQKVCRADSGFQKLGLKQFMYSKNVCGEMLWRLPKRNKVKNRNKYSVEKTSSSC